MVHVEMQQISDAYIQYQDISGNWITAEVIPNESAQIIHSMHRVSGNYDSERVRAVDSYYRILDIL